MKALVWHGKEDIRYDTVSDPEIEDDRDAIIKVTSCAICGSDLHLFHNFIPAMLPGDIMGHEMMGEVVEVGKGVNGTSQEGRSHRRALHHLVRRMRAVQARQLFRLRDDQPQEGARRQGIRPRHRGPVRLHASDRRLSRRAGRISARSICRHHAREGSRQPYGRAGSVPRRHLPTGWQGAVQCDIQPTDTVAIWGCGPVGQMAIRSAVLLGAKQVVAIDRLPERLSMAEAGGATPSTSRPRASSTG